MKWIALLAISLVWTALAFAETGSRFTDKMEIDPSLVITGFALIALLVPFLYDGSFFSRKKKNEYRTSRYHPDRHGGVQGHRDRFRGRKLDKDEVRNKARRSL